MAVLGRDDTCGWMVQVEEVHIKSGRAAARRRRRRRAGDGPAGAARKMLWILTPPQMTPYSVLAVQPSAISDLVNHTPSAGGIRQVTT